MMVEDGYESSIVMRNGNMHAEKKCTDACRVKCLLQREYSVTRCNKYMRHQFLIG